MNVTIRPAKKSDLKVICSNEQKAYQHPWSNNLLQESLVGKYCCFVMLMDEINIGHLVCQNVVDEVHLHNVCVLPQHQGKGLGKRWLEYLHLYSNELESKYILLEVRESNIVAKLLYEKMGYREIGFRKNYYKTDNSFENAIVMKLTLLKLNL
jgi:ribosomal-protein-alanine N-acetyltransferase